MGLTLRRRSARRDRGFSHRERGQALVEFAFVAPIMALILVSLVQFAFIFERQIGIENAVRDAARRGATYTTDSSNWSTNGTFVLNLLETEALPNAQGYSSGNLISDSVCYDDQTDASGLTSVKIRVSVAYNHPLFLPLITQILDPLDGTTDNGFHVSTYSTFTVQNNASSSASVGGTNRCVP